MNDGDKTVITAAAMDLEKEVKLMLDLWVAHKAGQPIAPRLPEVVAGIEKAAADVKAAAPVIKAGHQTTEFWLVLLAMAVSVLPAGLGESIAPHTPLIDAGLAIVFAILRTVLKVSAPQENKTTAP